MLAIDTSTSRIVVSAGRLDGTVIKVLTWPAAHRHGELLLAGVEALIEASGHPRRTLAGIVVGTGPGAFTGLRVGLATAKTLARALGLPIVGVGTGRALLEAAPGSVDAGRTVVLLPAGPRDRVEVRADRDARLLPGGTDPTVGPGETVIAVDLDGRAPADALERGMVALDGLGAALLRLGAARLASGEVDDVDLLVPDYVTLPRGVAIASGEIALTTDPR